MATAESLDPHTSMAHLIAVHLRRQREQHEMSGAALADFLGVHRSSVARMEAGTIALNERHATKIDKAWGTGGIFLALVKTAKGQHNNEWFKERTDKESRATTLRLWQLSWVHGMFQTEDYARAQFQAAGLRDVEANIATRMSRQRLLDRDPPPMIFALMDQGVIEQPVGGPAVMRAQLAHLVAMAALPNVVMRVVPRSAGAHVGRDGSFEVISIAGVGGSDTAYADANVAGRLVTDVAEVDSFHILFDRIGSIALPTTSSLDLIKETMEAM
ncbi:helix-turn-helix domain-containing protein [Thermomonospora umbrina]|uniref:Helix-turn-helix protein n=1 Tax=Thermomonospora umbrina TaxID=111806 RepID=A0A3D9SP62_9ACTN|nr:Scr1 family TA system antitoxin-like transcriptional regulator [Thermomonospora umbrina]REE97688.1 helix-turn-helix protein [Thermomonospora umbrina]